MKWLKIGVLVMVVALTMVAIPVVRVVGYVNRCTNNSIESCAQVAPMVLKELRVINRWVRLPILNDMVGLLERIEPFLSYQDYLLGREREISYMFMLLNDQELRTNGGFMGSYAVADMRNGEYEMRFQDIYVPDGQVEGYVAPPEPLQKAFQTGSHRLPNADWSPDFPKSAAAIRWFMDKGGEIEADVLVTVNLSSIEEILEVVGNLEVEGYGEVDAGSVYGLLQENTEVGFFPGSTQKKDVITATGQALFGELAGLNWKKKLKIAKLVMDDLERENILINSLYEPVQELLVRNNWAGRYSPVPCSGGECQSLTVGIVEMNLGSNKANCCVSRNVKHKITSGNGRLIHLIEVEFFNSSMYEAPMKPDFYGGNYLSYLRFYLPEDAENIQVTASPSLTENLGLWPEPYTSGEGLDIQKVYGFREVGLFHTTRAGMGSGVKLIYDIKDLENDVEVNILKQHGVREVASEINVLGEEYLARMEEDFFAEVKR